MTHTPLLNTPRPGWEDYFLGIATAVSKRGDCCRVEVGSILVDNTTKDILASGYNGSEPGGPSCRAGECPRCLSNTPSHLYAGADVDYSCCIETHSESNCAIRATRNLRLPQFRNTTMYITREPCFPCMNSMRVLEIPRVVHLVLERVAPGTLATTHWKELTL